MNYSEDDLLPLSKLADLLFCPRRAALHLLEGIWQENVLTAEGHNLHDRVHEAETECRDDVRIARSLRLRSLRLGLIGMADVVEFHTVPAGCPDEGISLAGVPGLWQPFPVEYKRGVLKHEFGYEVQLCAQALCLEEMLAGNDEVKVRIPAGAIFYGKSHRRQEVAFTPELRAATEKAARQLHDLIADRTTPTARYQKKCPHCSLYQQCLPKITGVSKKIDLYMAKGGDLSMEALEP